MSIFASDDRFQKAIKTYRVHPVNLELRNFGKKQCLTTHLKEKSEKRKFLGISQKTAIKRYLPLMSHTIVQLVGNSAIPTVPYKFVQVFRTSLYGTCGMRVQLAHNRIVRC